MDLIDAFASPIQILHLENTAPLNTAAAAKLVDQSNQTPGIIRSNVGGWHSVPDLTLHREPPFAPLMQRLVGEVQKAIEALSQARNASSEWTYRYGIQAWGMVMEHGDYVTTHDHAEAHFSGVYYLDAGDAESDLEVPSGQIVFLNPRGGGAAIAGLDLFPQALTVQPETGMLILFPGYLAHYVHPYRGLRPRVCVSFNVRMDPKRDR